MITGTVAVIISSSGFNLYFYNKRLVICELLYPNYNYFLVYHEAM